MNNETNFRAEFIRFLKSRDYPADHIFCNAKFGETYVDYLITLPNPNEKLAIITAQSLYGKPQIKRQVESCRQEMGEFNYLIWIFCSWII